MFDSQGIYWYVTTFTLNFVVMEWCTCMLYSSTNVEQTFIMNWIWMGSLTIIYFTSLLEAQFIHTEFD